MLLPMVIFTALAFVDGPAPTDDPLVTKPKAKPVSSVAIRTIEQQIVDYTNQERRRHGLPVLQMDVGLLTTARQHAHWMASRGNLTHTTLPVAENIAMGQTTSAEAVRDWMQSPGHRANMLGRGYQRVGAAAFRSANGSVYWCVQFH